MSNSYHHENNPYFRREPGLPPPDQPYQPPSSVAQVLPQLEGLPAQPQVQPQPQFRQPRFPQRVPTRHPPYPIHPREQTRFSEPPGFPVQPLPTAQSSPPPHDEQTQPLHTPTGVSPPPIQAPPRQRQRDRQEQQSSFVVPPPRKTKFLTWFLATFCFIFGVIIIVGGLIVLIVYLVFRPHLPKFEISSATLNAAYLDMDYLLNADMTLLTNFTNPNRKVRNDFSYVILDLYYGSNAIATQYIEPFSTARLESWLANVHMISSQVRLPSKDSEKLRKLLESNGLVVFEVKGLVRVRSKFGSFLRYSYWLYSHCSIALTGPPSGVLRASQCRTKR
ncbi:NDR1/HIN1-like protein 6 [Rhodamnia argentea]|uniref:NDR1/HIN1-like protein 6 n=1 Tax=Rhodamnia argentea TaxID=178133 RepID=A0A8B8QD81_9MYRT|nr:NDR1/HIN1-like protein 6 [Rhodamnia argentea]